MFKKILLGAAALSALALVAPQAEAGYGYGYGQGYGYNHGYSRFYHRSYSYYRPYCFTKTRPVVIRVWDDYAYGYIFKTVYRDYRVCH